MRLARPQPRAADSRATPRAFTLVELLVVIVVIGLLIGIIGLVGSQVINAQKVYRTEATMKAVTMAIDQFALDNPLRATYDMMIPPTIYRSFGPYPPYQVQGAGTSNTVGGCVDLLNRDPTLTGRLYNDTGAANVRIYEVDDPSNNDIRALYSYLRFFVPDALAAVPEAALTPLRPDLNATTGASEFIKMSLATGLNTNPQSFDVLGIHDAWGVPLDYYLDVKLEYTMDALGWSGWRVTKRTPVLRSLGITREQYDAQVRSDEGSDPDEWILSSELPTPFCTAIRNPLDGTLVTGSNGWVHAVAAIPANENSRKSEYAYVPYKVP